MSRKLKYVLVVFTWVFLSGFSFYLGISLLRGNAVETASANAEKPAIAKASFLDGILGLFKSEENQAKNLGGSESKPESPSATEQAVSPVTQEPPATDSGKEHTGEFRASTWFSDYEAMKRTVKFYNEIHPFIYGMKGGLTNTGALVSSWGKESKIARVAELKSLNPNVKIIPTIFRWENPKEKISENIGLNGRSDIRDLHIKNILFEVDTYGYDGIDIDYEGMSCNKKEKFEEFIVLLSKEMKKRNKILSIAVHPKTGSSKPKMVSCKGLGRKVKVDFQENWRGPTTHDYEFLAKYADRIKVMAYELHPRKYRNPGPGPQAPNAWIASIIEYAKTRVPSYKLYMAIPTYGYDWALNCRAPAKAVYFSDANRIRSMHGAEYQPTNMSKIYSENKKSRSWTNLTKFMYIHENKVYEDPSIWYNSNGCDRVAFYMNKKAFEDKMNLLRKYKIGGFSFWQLLSDNDPGINDYLELLVNNKLPAVKTIDEEIAENRLKQEISANKAAESNKSSETPEKVNSITDDKESRNTGRN